MRDRVENDPELKNFSDEFKRSLFFHEQNDENPLLGLMNSEDPNKVLNIFSIYIESKTSPSVEFLRLSLFYLSNFPSSAYSDLNFELLDMYFYHISKKISDLCSDNESFLQVIFSLFNLHQKTNGVSLKADLIKNFILKRNMNVHYELMTIEELVSIPLYLSVIFRDSKVEFIQFFENNILPNLNANLQDLDTSEISQLVIMFSNFEYRKYT